MGLRKFMSRDVKNLTDGKYPVEFVRAEFVQRNGKRQLVLKYVLLHPKNYFDKFILQKVFGGRCDWFHEALLKAMSWNSYPRDINEFVGRRAVLHLEEFDYGGRVNRYPQCKYAHHISTWKGELPPQKKSP